MFPLLAAACLVCLAPPSGLSVDRAAVDLGVISPWRKTVHRFLLTNGGNKVLRLGAMETSCGCTVGALEKKELAPGETIFLEASLQPKGQEGEIHESIFVQVQDAAEKKLHLTLSGKLVAPFRLIPDTLEFKDLSRDKFQIQRTWIRPKDASLPQGVITTEVDAKLQAFLSVTLSESAEGKALEVWLDPRAMPGVMAHKDGGTTVMIEVQTPGGGGGVDRAPLQLKWSFPHSFNTEPRTLAWIGNNEPKDSTRTVRIRRPDGRVFRILKVESTSKVFEIR